MAKVLSNQVGERAVLVTGASSGIGQDCALYLDKLGYQVFAGVRKEEDGAALRQQASARLIPVCLDVTNNESITRAKELLLDKTGGKGLWGLVNNAGVSSNGPLEFYPMDEIRQMFEVNVFGLLAVTQTFLPLLRTGQGRIINISSVSAMMAFPFAGPYCASKYSVEVMSDCLRMELSPWSIPVSVIEPAYIASAMWNKSHQTTAGFIQALPVAGQQYYGRNLTKLNELGARQGAKGDSPERIAKVVAKILVARRPGALYREGRVVNFLRFMKLLPRGIREKMLTMQLKTKPTDDAASVK
jgi:NAD(P)-dependent dehydrogenase (short-subunit alcohol dehydrogenase family)